MVTLARRVNHSVEMRSWIKARTEMSVLYPAFFRRISNEVPWGKTSPDRDIPA